MSSNRQNAIGELQARLSTILVANGFSTNAGAMVLIGEVPVFGPDDPIHALSIQPGADEVTFKGEQAFVKLPVKVAVMAKANLSDVWSTIEDVIADVKRAVETDHDLSKHVVPRGFTRGPTTPLERQDGSEFIGVEIEYRLEFPEVWGDP